VTWISATEVSNCCMISSLQAFYCCSKLRRP